MTADIYCGNCTQIERAVFHVLIYKQDTHWHHLQIGYLLYHPRFRHFPKNLESLRFRIDIFLRGRFYDALRTIAPRAIERVAHRYCQNIIGVPHGVHYITGIILSLCCNAPVTAVKV